MLHLLLSESGMDLLLRTAPLILFFLINLFLGIYFRQRQYTLSDYALGNRSLGLGALTMTLISTFIGAASFGIMTNYVRGLVSLVVPLCLSLMALLLGTTLFPKMRHFKEHYSMGQVMGTLYGSWTILPTLGITTLFSIIVIVGQLVAVGSLGSFFFDISNEEMILLVGIATVFYTTWGGVRLVAFTDVFQFSLLALSVVALALVRIYHAGGLEAIIAAAPPEHFLFFGHPYFPLGLLFALVLVICPNLLVSPPIIQRALMARSGEEVRQIFTGFAIFYPVMRFLLFFVGISLYTIPEEVLKITTRVPKPFFILKYACHNSPLLQGLLLVAITAVVMSTIDSHINATVVAWINDWHLVTKGSAQTPTPAGAASEKTIGQRPLKSFFLAFMTFFLGIICTILAATLSSYETRTLEFLSYGAMLSSLITIPFLFGVAGLKGNRAAIQAQWGTLVFGGLLFYRLEMDFELLKNIFPEAIESFSRVLKPEKYYLVASAWGWFLAALLSIVVFLLVHYITYNGFVWVKRGTYFQPEGNYSFQWGRPSWLLQPRVAANHWVALWGKRTYLFGFFIYVSSLLVPLMVNLKTGDLVPLLVLHLIRVLLVTGLLLESQWPHTLRNYFNIYYIGTIFYTVPIVSILTVFYDHTNHFTGIHFILPMFLLIILVDWRTFLSMQISAFLFSIFYWRFMEGRYLPLFEEHSGYHLLLYALYSFLTAMIFIRQRVHEIKGQKARLQNQLNAQKRALLVQLETNQQLVNALHPKSSLMRQMADSIAQMKKGQATDQQLDQLRSGLTHFQHIGQYAESYLPIKVVSINLQKLIRDVFEHLAETDHFLKRWLEQIEQPALSNSTRLQGDPFYIAALLKNSLKALYYQYPHQIVRLSIQETRLRYHIPSDKVKQEHTKEIEAIWLALLVNEALVPKPVYTSEEVLLLENTEKNPRFKENERIIEAHYGKMYVNLTSKQKGSIFYVLPKEVGHVRPKVTRLSDEDILEHTKLDNAEDQQFLDQVKAEHPEWDQTKIKHALCLAKHYHRHQRRHSGEPFYFHLLSVAGMVSPHTQNIAVVVAALLHDTIEDTAFSPAQLQALFGREVAQIVQDVTYLYTAQARKIKLRKQAVLKDLLKKESRSPLLVKLFDRLHNMYTIQAHSSPIKRQLVAQESLDFFVPLAELLRLPKIAETLRDLAQRTLENL